MTVVCCLVRVCIDAGPYLGEHRTAYLETLIVHYGPLVLVD